MNPKTIIVPHTHWDREWYLPFQKFRIKLVSLIDELLEILDEHDYRFMLDGQTVVLEDYFEIRPERKKDLLKRIKKGNITAGPWYILPDEWLVGQESLIRNLEYSYVLAKRLDIPLMDISYLPDCFGHSSAIPQLLNDLTTLKTVVLWRGVPPEVMTVPFTWKSHQASEAMINGVYLPGGYGNTAILPEDYESFVDVINGNIKELEPFSPVPVYLLMNGSDHRFPQPFAIDYVERMRKEGIDISIGSLRDYVDHLEKAISEAEFQPPTFIGEFRSPARAPLLQDTYSARMWIKIWNRKVEDLLTMTVEPISSLLWFHLNHEYPTGYMETAWKWLLKNHPHDSICGCSVDQTHDEMKARFSWAESIGESVIDKARSHLQKIASPSEASTLIAFSASGTKNNPVYFEFSYPKEKVVNGLRAPDGKLYDVQSVKSKEDIFFETTVGLRMAKMGMKLLPGRKLMDFYINGVEFFEGDEPGLLEVRFIADRHPVGEFDMEAFKREAIHMIESRQFKKVHLVAARPTQSVYASFVPLQPWTFTQLFPVEKSPECSQEAVLEVGSDHVSNRFYEVTFSKDGSLGLLNRETGLLYGRLHVFEDLGDRGDEYTFGRVEAEKARPFGIKREILAKGPIIAEIRQTMSLEIHESIDASRGKRKGYTKIPVESKFRFYRDSPRIEVMTRIVNTGKDHRLRICFDLPFKSNKSITSTHFGCMVRDGAPEIVPSEEELDRTKSTYPEKPSGIQPQKRFIRVEDESGKDAITVLNRGLPEVELAEGNRLAITLVRSIGWLSRSDFPERPIHAGPPEETPGAQEMNVEYEFHYAFLAHSIDAPLSESSDHADAFSDEATVISFNEAEPPRSLSEPVIQIDNPSVRVSSFRVRDGSLLVTMYNLENTEQTAAMQVSSRISGASEVRIDGSEKAKIVISENSINLAFSPRGIKMCRFQAT